MHWIYHKNFEAKVVTAEEYEQYLNDGWVDSPAKITETHEEEPKKKKAAKAAEE